MEQIKNSGMHAGEKMISGSLLPWLALGLLAVLLAALLLVLVLRRKRTCWDCAVVHEQGKRDSQQDAYDVLKLEEEGEKTEKAPALMAVVADGMGGLAYGAEISKIAVQSACKAFFALRDKPAGFALRQMIREAQHYARKFLEEKGGISGGSTFAAAILCKNTLNVASVGDSRVALLRRGQIFWLNPVHNYGAELDSLAKRGILSKVEARMNPRRRALTSYIGIEELVKAEVRQEGTALAKGDVVMLMTDGMEAISEQELILAVKGKNSKAAAGALRAAVQAKGAPNQDNYTAIIIRIK